MNDLDTLGDIKNLKSWQEGQMGTDTCKVAEV